MALWQDDVARYFRVAFSVSVTPIGLVGNVICMIVFWQKSLNNNTLNGVMNAFFSLFNIIALVDQFLIVDFLPFFDVELVDISNASCKVFTYFRYTFAQLPCIHQTLTTFILFLNIKYPWMGTFTSRKSFVFKIIGAELLLILTADLSYFWYNLIQVNVFNNVTNQTTTSYVCTSTFAIVVQSNITQLMFRFVVPFVLILIFNYQVLVISRVSKRRVSANQEQIKRSNIRIVKSTVTISILQLVCYLPWAISFWLNFIYILTNSSGSSFYSEYRLNIIMLYNMSISFTYVFNTSVFFVNIIHNKLFKTELYRLLRAVVNRRSSQSVHINTIDIQTRS